MSTTHAPAPPVGRTNLRITTEALTDAYIEAFCDDYANATDERLIEWLRDDGLHRVLNVTPLAGDVVRCDIHLHLDDRAFEGRYHRRTFDLPATVLDGAVAGHVNPRDPHRGDHVTVPAGTPITSTAWPHEVRPAGRTYTVQVHATDEWPREVVWPGSGGYWRYAPLDDVHLVHPKDDT